MFCKHHYQYTQGYFFCTKCGHRRYRSRVGRRKSKKIITISIIFVLLGGGLYLYSDEIIDLSSDVPKEIEKISNIPIPTREEIKDTIEETKNTMTETISSATTIAELDTDSTALKIHDLINEQRSSNGLRQLGWHPKLGQAATNHSDDMATSGYFSHDSPNGSDFTRRYAQVGFSCQIPISSMMYSGGAENIFMLEGYYGEDTIAREAVEGWMNSQGHRDNILTPYFLNEGIGIGVADDGTIYITQDFC